MLAADPTPIELEAQRLQLQPQDTMAEAGRKILLDRYVQMLAHEAGSRTGEDIEDVHKMRVATRQMRSALRLFKPYYRSKDVTPINRGLRDTARALGQVRDLDVMLESMEKHQTSLSEDDAGALQGVMDRLDERRSRYRDDLNDWLDSKSYRRFNKQFKRFLLEEKASPDNNGAVQPHELRHVAPMIIHERLAAVRAYDPIIVEAEAETLHSLRIEFKRLRYALQFFQPVLGTSLSRYIKEIKGIQDYLGRLNDVSVAHQRLDSLKKLKEQEKAVIEAYIAGLEIELTDHVENFQTVWERFNTRTVQKDLADALLILR